MKKTLSLFLSLILCFPIAGCSISSSDYDYSNDYTDKSNISSSVETKLSLTQTTKRKISASTLHTLGLNSDGTVVATGSEQYNRLDVDDWKDIVAVSTGGAFSVGLKSDGTVFVTDEYLQSAVEDWKEIVDIASSYHIVGLKKDGTVLAVNTDGGRPDWGQCDTSSWNNIIQVSVGDKFTAGLKEDGSVVITGELENSDEIESWDNIVSIAAGFSCLLGIKEDGSVLVAGLYRSGSMKTRDGKIDVSDWSDIVSIDADESYVLGLKSDGSVVCEICAYSSPIEDVKTWRNVVAISAAQSYAVGLTADGKILVAGNPNFLEMYGIEEGLNNWDLID